MRQAILKEHELVELGKQIAAGLKGGETVGLIGPLGAGKTTLVRAIVSALGITEHVSSPSFVICHEYGDARMVEHWDLYRLNAPPDELLEPPSESLIRLIEWIDRVPEVQNQSDLIVTLAYVAGKGNLREVNVNGPSAKEYLLSS